MPVLQTHADPLWGIWKIEETWEEMLRQLDRQTDYISYINNCKSDNRKKEWLAVRLLLKTLTGKEMKIAYHPNGTPYLIDNEYNISISHTKGYAAVCLNRGKPAGIDIEHRSERIHKIKSRFLNEQEWEILGANPSTDTLLICWCVKEATFKLAGRQTADWQKDFHILTLEHSSCNNGIATVKETLTPRSATCRISYHIYPEFIVAYSL